METKTPARLTTPRARAAYGTMSDKRQVRREATKSRLIAATCRLCTERGYELTTIDDITRAAEVSRAAFYLHFGSKADVIGEIVKMVSEELGRRYCRLAEIGPGADLEQLTAWVADFVQTCRSNQPAMLLLERMLMPGNTMLDEIGFYLQAMTILGARLPRFAIAAKGLDRDTRSEAFLFFFDLQAAIRHLSVADTRLDEGSLQRLIASRLLALTRE